MSGIELPPKERTPLVESLLRLIGQQQAEIGGLRAEIARLKGLPRRPTIRPSTLNGPHPDPSHKKRRKGKRRGSAKRHKTRELTIHETIPLTAEGLPDGTRANGCEDFVVQDLPDRSVDATHANVWHDARRAELESVGGGTLTGPSFQVRRRLPANSVTLFEVSAP